MNGSSRYPHDAHAGEVTGESVHKRSPLVRDLSMTEAELQDPDIEPARVENVLRSSAPRRRSHANIESRTIPPSERGVRWPGWPAPLLSRRAEKALRVGARIGPGGRGERTGRKSPWRACRGIDAGAAATQWPGDSARITSAGMLEGEAES
jgi:hypothetical protein